MDARAKTKFRCLQTCFGYHIQFNPFIEWTVLEVAHWREFKTFRRHKKSDPAFPISYLV